MHIVTGGAGFIGSNLARLLIERTGDDVIVVDDLSDGHKFANLADLSIADYLDKDEFLALLRSGSSFASGIKSILHQGACSVTTEWDGRYMMQNNYTSSKEILDYCLEREIPFIYASSAAVYGSSTGFAEHPANEKPLNVYGYSKLLFDQYVRRLSLSPRQQVVGLRYFNVYGPREQHKAGMASVAWHFNRQLAETGEVRLFEGSGGYAAGEQRRDFVYVDDVCAVNLWFLEHRGISGVFNSGTGRAQTFNEVAQAVIDWHGRGSIRYVPFPEGLRDAYQSYTCADLTALRAAGCDVEFRDVAHGVRTYLDTING
ncbi:MAG: ADP-glyceromanno-heptose 6-epimerase [Gammaproteobacteria bacterium]|nr:ADP-glyceromanno-heptose 6-epimerase [Gammaproteobacteria bacterium]MDH4253679.1 ADP-glyceromanno-heptose 6-epimerase [Gammaproteobacteria bacterium]MDH5311328.1 ADP-glyceromanno-heptose 6-epimerase [Gammaproteobacteria bacterium]